MTLPGAVLKVALEKGPFDTLNPIDFTDLSDRLLSVSTDRGRDDVLEDFRPGRLRVLLDNSDGLLDPQNPSGLVYEGDEKGFPLCPVTLDLVWSGTEYRRFTGYLGEECWKWSPNPYGPASAVELVAMDQLGYSPEFPNNVWHMILRQLGVASEKPYWHLQMDTGLPVVGDGSEIKNRSGSGGVATFSSPLALLGRSTNLQSGIASPALQMPEDSYLTCEAADVMPDGDELNLTAMLWWKHGDGSGLAADAMVAQMVAPGGGTVRWTVEVDTSGVAQINTYDSGGTLVDSDSITNPLGRWDNQTWHLVVVRFTSGNNLDVWFGGYQATLSATSTVYESDLLIGPSGATNTYVDEVFVVRRSITDDEVAGTFLTASYFSAWMGYSHADALGAMLEASGKIVSVDDTDEWHVPAPDPDWFFGGIQGPNSLPSTLAEAALLVAGPFGARWATRDGYLRVRTVTSLSDATYAAHYATVSATFTDEDATLGAGEYRHAGIEVSGYRLDRILNRVGVRFYYLTSAGDFTTMTLGAVVAEDDASHARYGLRAYEELQPVAWYGWTIAASAADEILDRYSTPRVEIGQRLYLDATTDPALAEWLCETCELELAVDVIYTPYDQSPRTVSGVNIQREQMELTPTSFTASLGVAKS